MGKKNVFKAPDRLSDGSLGDVRSHCNLFQMTVSNEEDMRFLAHLYRTIWINGGQITVVDKEQEATYYFETNESIVTFKVMGVQTAKIIPDGKYLGMLSGGEVVSINDDICFTLFVTPIARKNAKIECEIVVNGDDIRVRKL